jgi:hypothetical protein
MTEAEQRTCSPGFSACIEFLQLIAYSYRYQLPLSGTGMQRGKIAPNIAGQ